MLHRSPLSVAIVASVCMLAGCNCGPELIEGDAAAANRDAGPPPDSGGPTFEDASGIGRTGLDLAHVSPDHGPFVGGNTVVLRGTGFTEDAQVSFGGRDVQGADHRLIDARRLAVVVPAGEVGPVDVAITVGENTVTLADGYTYEALHVDPNSGSIAGGTFVTIVGSGTDFREGDNVLFGRTACQEIEVVSTTRINCRAPAAVAGTVDVTVVSALDGTMLVATDGFTYFDSTDPVSGGLGGGPISGSINITVVDGATGLPLPQAFAMLGEDIATTHKGLTDSLGQISFSGPDVMAPATIHVMKHCYERTSFVAFDARDVTIFLTPWQDPMCGEGEPGGGGRGRNGSFIEGELVWMREFGVGSREWYNVPPARTGWTRVAYVYTTQFAVGWPNPPPEWGSRQRVTEADMGTRGYPYNIFARPAGLAVYAIAGLEETATRRFVPYVMGVARNVLAAPGQTVRGVDVVMDIPLDHYLETQLADLPSATPIGPDRFRLEATIDLAGEGVIVRKVNGVELDVVRARDASRPFRFFTQPALQGTLSDGRYTVEAGWFTGDFDAAPYTVAIERGVREVDQTLVMDGFFGVPQAVAPGYGEMLPADRILRWQADGAVPDLQVVSITGADGNPAWRVFLPGNVHEAPIPDLSTLATLFPEVPPELIQDIPSGFLQWRVQAIGIPGFDFNEFRYSDMNDLYWTRWARNSFTAQRE